MSKIKLSLDDLHVQSFFTSPESNVAAGTVFGLETDVHTEMGCGSCPAGGTLDPAACADSIDEFACGSCFSFCCEVQSHLPNC